LILIPPISIGNNRWKDVLKNDTFVLLYHFSVDLIFAGLYLKTPSMKSVTSNKVGILKCFLFAIIVIISGCDKRGDSVPDTADPSCETLLTITNVSQSSFYICDEGESPSDPNSYLFLVQPLGVRQYIVKYDNENSGGCYDNPGKQCPVYVYNAAKVKVGAFAVEPYAATSKYNWSGTSLSQGN
jgi:hypothetical protein